jgi:hypothetical protein
VLGVDAVTGTAVPGQICPAVDTAAVFVRLNDTDEPSPDAEAVTA